MTDSKSNGKAVVKKKAKRRSPETTAALKTLISKAILTGHTRREIAEMCTVETGQKISMNVVRDFTERIKDEWERETKKASEHYMAEELARLDVMEAEAWAHYRASGGVINETKEQDFIDAEGVINKQIVTRSTKDDNKTALQWFDRILKVQLNRRKVLRLESVVNVNNVMAVKGYAVFNPSSDWPDPHLPVPNVIDAEFLEGGDS